MAAHTPNSHRNCGNHRKARTVDEWLDRLRILRLANFLAHGGGSLLTRGACRLCVGQCTRETTIPTPQGGSPAVRAAAKADAGARLRYRYYNPTGRRSWHAPSLHGTPKGDSSLSGSTHTKRTWFASPRRIKMPERTSYHQINKRFRETFLCNLGKIAQAPGQT